MREATNVSTVELEWTEIDRRLQGFARRRAVLDAEELPWLLAAKRAGVHERYGFATVLEYLERCWGMDRRQRWSGYGSPRQWRRCRRSGRHWPMGG